MMPPRDRDRRRLAGDGNGERLGALEAQDEAAEVLLDRGARGGGQNAHQSGIAAASEDTPQLIERFLPLARKLAARYIRSGEPFDDASCNAGATL